MVCCPKNVTKKVILFLKWVFFFVKTQFFEQHLATTHIISESSSASNTSKLLQLIPMTAKS